MNLQRAHYFVTVAKQMSFTRAAEELHVAQSALSRQVKLFEHELGVELLDRAGPRFALTAAGEVAVAETEVLLTLVERSVGRIRAAAAGTGGELRIAHTRSWAGGNIARAVERFRVRYPGTTIIEHRGFTARNIELAAAGDIDVAIVRPPIYESGLAVKILDQEALLVAVPADHRFTADSRIDPAELADEPVVFWPRINGPGMHDAIVRQLWPHRPPNVVRNEADDEQVLHAVAAGVGIAPMPAGRATAFRVPGVELREVAGEPRYLEVAAAYRSDNPNIALRQFLEVAEELDLPTG
ncbi:DNA-binding transcriptional LysR family regulator [Rhodococcus wratislaviensis]|uniref:LysR family transcriptional regulator n=2 Tax=Rhodococcus wratislaviensis TaxID=44752 RepID=A0AB38F6R5_RHOWR|nr:LysR family transcriptional regulator [Rhodococcus wratislaviensis]REE77506.1 DNA-binding transcriptional LysR family regulator [Rhodococcus wratislaviensis]GAF49496.1 putative LysR family transcriptional regulator [Rhodococcus wratislaviensis NBRC 100605]SPZ35378.1 LysR family transcriptional regulator [Rhodococcus wratislaviensis]